MLKYDFRTSQGKCGHSIQVRWANLQLYGVKFHEGIAYHKSW